MTRVARLLVIGILMTASVVQAQILTGNVIGTVKDESGAVLPGVTVTLSSPSALPAGPRSVVTNEKGEYRFTQLEPGSFALDMTLTGFGGYHEEALQVAVGGTTERNVVLKVGTVAETVTVSGESPMVDTRRVGAAENLKEEVLDELPAHRYYLTEYGKWTGGIAAVDPSGRGADLSVMGSGTGENTVLYDGIIANNPNGGGLWASSDLDAVQEVQVVTIGGSAEYQMAQGGVFNVVYKSGMNTFGGDGSAFWYPDSLISKPVKLPCNCSLGSTGYTNVLWRNFTLHVGGPIVRDKLWFYAGGNYDGRRQGNPGVDPALLARSPLWYSHDTFSKVTWQINHRLRFRQTFETDPYGGQAVATLQRPLNTLTANFGLVPVYASEVNYTFSNNMLLTARATGFFDPGYTQDPLSGDRVTPQHIDSLTGIASGGVASIGVSNLSRHGQAVKVNRFIQGARVEHDVRFGVQFDHGYADSFSAFPSGVQYTDIGGKPDQATFRSAYVTGAEYNAQGVWGEDQMTVGGRLTVSLGVRFDRMHAISPDEPAVDNLVRPTGTTIKGLGDMFTWKVWAPRLGFNFKLSEDGRTLLRGSYGRAYRSIYTSDFSNVYPGLSPITLARYNPATSGYTTIISVTNPTANIKVDPNIRAPFTDSYSVGLDRELVANLALGVTFAHKHGQDQIGWKDIGGVYGTQTVTLATGQAVTVEPLLNATSARIFLRTNGPGFFNRYNGLVLALTKRMSHRWQGTVSYTYSKAEGLITSGTTGQDPNDYVNAAGRLSTDRPQMFAVKASYDIPKIGVLASTSFMQVSGTPYAPQTLISLPQGRLSVNIASPDGAYRLPSQHLLTFQFNKSLFQRGSRRLEVGAEIMNALQNKAFLTPVTRNFFASNFGQSAGDWIEPRRMDLLVRVQF